MFRLLSLVTVMLSVYVDSQDVTRYVRFIDDNGIERQGQEIQGSGRAWIIEGELLGEYEVTTQLATIVKLLPPLPIMPPPMIICVGLNYLQHANETGLPVPDYPILFAKNPATITGPYDDIIFPEQCEGEGMGRLDYETELAFVIGKTAKDVSVEDALSYIAGYTVANDVSAREWQMNDTFSGSQWNRGKSFDTFCPVGPALVMANTQIDPDNVEIASILNGEIQQYSNTNDMIFSVADMVKFISEDTTLLPGTLILTGTPEGVGFAQDPPLYMKPGDTIECSVQQIGTITNRIVRKQKKN